MQMSTVLVLAYNFLIRDGVCFLGMGGRLLAVYDIMRYVKALFIPPSGAILMLVECVIELCMMLVLVSSLSL